MITERIKKDLFNRGKRSVLNFNGLIQLLEDTTIEFVDSNINQAYGMATIDKVHLDIDTLKFEDDSLVFFIILHEYCHGLRIMKMGKVGMISALSLEEFDDMADHIIYEELLADRYGRLKFYQLNNEVFPAYRTQMLYQTSQRADYKDRIKPLHGLVQNSEEKYDALINSLLIV